MLDITNIKEEFIKYFDLDILIEYCKDKRPENIIPEDYNKLSPLFNDVEFNHVEYMDGYIVDFMFSNEKFFIQFCFDKEKNVRIDTLRITCNTENEQSYINIEMLFRARKKKDVLIFFFGNNKHIPDNLKLEVNENLAHRIEYTQLSESNIMDSVNKTIEYIMNFDQKQFKIDFLNQIIYHKPIKDEMIPKELLDFCSLVLDTSFNIELLKKLKCNFFVNEQKTLNKENNKYKPIKQ